MIATCKKKQPRGYEITNIVSTKLHSHQETFNLISVKSVCFKVNIPAIDIYNGFLNPCIMEREGKKGQLETDEGHKTQEYDERRCDLDTSKYPCQGQNHSLLYRRN